MQVIITVQVRSVPNLRETTQQKRDTNILPFWQKILVWKYANVLLIRNTKKKDFSVKHTITDMISIQSASIFVLSFQFAKPSLDAHVKNERTRSDTRSLPYLRETQLYSRSSQAHLRILGRKVDALGKDGDIYGKKISIFVLFLNLNWKRVFVNGPDVP